MTHPEVKMDNNPAEQSIRNPVLGRNGYYGSGSLWCAELAAMHVLHFSNHASVEFKPTNMASPLS